MTTTPDDDPADRVAAVVLAVALGRHDVTAVVDSVGWVVVSTDGLAQLLADPGRCAAVLATAAGLITQVDGADR